MFLRVRVMVKSEVEVRQSILPLRMDILHDTLV